MKPRAIWLLAIVLVTLVVVSGTAVTAHHREGHTKGGGGNSGGGGNDVRVSFNAGVLEGQMLVFPAIEDIAVSNRPKPAISDSQLIVKRSKNAETRSFLKFNVSGVNEIVGTVISAKILLRSTNTSGYGGDLGYVEDNSWSETMNWGSQPSIVQPGLSGVGRVVSDTYYEWDVLSIVAPDGNFSGDGDYSFAMTCDSCSSAYESSEASMIPNLVVVVSDGSSVESGEPGDPVLVGAGDIASCGTAGPSGSGAEQTAQLLDDIVLGDSDVSVFTAGDGAYNEGTLAQYQDCYDPTWGRHFDWTSPSPGNHEYFTPGAEGYYTYFGARAGDPSEGYYSYDIPNGDGIGSWHVVALNSNCAQIGGCGVGSPQNIWLREDLVASTALCTVAYLHHPPHSSGEHGSELNTQPLMDVLWEFGAEILVAGHDHNYERFTPQKANGVPDLANGVRLIVAGTGGRGLRAFRTPIANSEARFNSLYGVLKLTLHSSSYDWEFVPVDITDPEPVELFSDAGSASCH